jgi:hypothetical protein
MTTTGHFQLRFKIKSRRLLAPLVHAHRVLKPEKIITTTGQIHAAKIQNTVKPLK